VSLCSEFIVDDSLAVTAPCNQNGSDQEPIQGGKWAGRSKSRYIAKQISKFRNPRL